MSTIIVPLSDFSGVAVEQIDLNKVPIFKFYDAGEGRQIRYLNMTGYLANLSSLKNSNLNHETLVILNVEGLVGKQISITAAHPVAAGVEFCCFASYADFDAIDAFAEQAKVAPGTRYLSGEITPVENFNVSSVGNTEATITKVIPVGAKYLFITNDIDVTPLDNMVVDVIG